MSTDTKKMNLSTETKKENRSNQSNSGLKPLDVNSENIADKWTTWILQFEIFLTANSLEKEDNEKKVAIFLHNLGADSLHIFQSFNVDRKVIKFDELIKLFDKRFKPKKNIAVERNYLFTRKQASDESIDEFVTDLKNLSLSCELGGKRESLVKTVMICGLTNNQIKERLLEEGDIELDKAIGIAKNMEISKVQTQQLEVQGNSTTISAINKQSHNSRVRKPSSGNFNNSAVYKQRTRSSSSYQHGTEMRKCQRCGLSHVYNSCPARGKQCTSCNKFNHFAKMCRYKNYTVKNLSVNKSQEFYVGKLVNNLTYDKDDMWTINLKINFTDIEGQLDTGAGVNVMSLNTVKSLNMENNITPNDNTKILTFSGENLKIIGCCNLKCEYSKNKNAVVKFHITDLECNTILGLPTCRKLNLIKKVCSNIVKFKDEDQIINNINVYEEYSDLFEGLGKLKNKVHLEIDKSIKPHIDANRKIPYKLMDKFKNEIERMLKIEVIEKITEATDWVNSVVLIQKADGQIRVCLDPRQLNKALKRSRYQLPDFEMIRSKLNGSKYFSLLDASTGFWSLELDEESSKLTTFNTPFGRFKYKRLPFGIKSSPEIFQQRMSECLLDIQGVVVYVDDILIYGKTREEHDQILKTVLDRIRQVNLKLNKNKCKICVNEIKYLGHIFSEKGISPDMNKVKAIKDIPQPQNVKELQRFMGMINYLGPFIEGLANKNINLRNLLKNNTEYKWLPEHEKEFNNLREIISDTPVLQYFDLNKPIVLSVDSSKNALGAVLLQEKPIAYASSTLNESQQRYAQIEKELLAIVYGCTKFHQYIFGQNITVETDHKPLITIFKKSLRDVPSRLQRMLLKIQKYDLNVIYKPGKKLLIADTLSRAAVDYNNELEELESEMQVQINALVTRLNVSEKKLTELQIETKKDETLQTLKDYHFNGWPKTKREVPNHVKCYFNIQDEIHYANGLILRKDSIVIPKSMQQQMLKLIHEGHQGVERSKNQVRGVIYWPYINHEIKNLVEACEICLQNKKGNTKLPMINHDIGKTPWEKVGIDLFSYKSKTYLIVVDYYSKYIELALLNNYNSETVTTHLKSIFSRHGIPQKVISDNGPPFNSDKFKSFSIDWCFEHITTSPYYPQSNGLVERHIGIVKQIFKKCEMSQTDPYIGILTYRNTPKGDLPSPSELLMSRKLRSKIPIHENNLKPKLVNKNQYQNKIKQNQNYTKAYYDKRTKKLNPFTEGNTVMYKKMPEDKVWVKGKVIQECEQPRSYIIENERGERFRRNRQHMIENKTYSSFGREIRKPVKFKDYV